jgi:hypothetical protein
MLTVYGSPPNRLSPLVTVVLNLYIYNLHVFFMIYEILLKLTSQPLPCL